MANIRLQVMQSAGVWHIDAQILRGPGLSGARNVVFLTFDSHQGRVTNGSRIHQAPAVFETAPSQMKLLKNALYGVQIISGWQIHDRQVLVIELAVTADLLGLFVANGPEQAAIGINVAVEIHVYKPGQLQESGVNLAHGSGVGRGYWMDQIAFEPRQVMFGGHFTRRSGVDTTVYGAAHQR